MNAEKPEVLKLARRIHALPPRIVLGLRWVIRMIERDEIEQAKALGKFLMRLKAKYR
jgi:hypothetical protein